MSLNLYTSENTKDPYYYDDHYFKHLAAHEFGHALGVGDAYGKIGYRDIAPKWSAPQHDMMRDNGTVSDQDIRMVLIAQRTNNRQLFPQVKGVLNWEDLEE